jgi:hypothetical protein
MQAHATRLSSPNPDDKNAAAPIRGYKHEDKKTPGLARRLFESIGLKELGRLVVLNCEMRFCESPTELFFDSWQ